MRKHLAKSKKVVWKIVKVVAAVYVLIYLSIYLSGVRHFAIGDVELVFNSLSVMPFIIIPYAYAARDQVDAYLSKREADLTEAERKKHRWSVRTVLWATWFVIYFPIYAYGQIYHPSISEADIFDLLIVLFYGLLGIGTAVPLSRENSESAKGVKSKEKR